MKNHVLRIVIVVLLVVSVNLFFYQKSFAFLPFGGMIISSTICTNGILLIVGPPMGGLFLFPFGAILYSFYSLHPGAWVLSGYVPGGACAIGPIVIPTQGTILMTGTSQ